MFKVNFRANLAFAAMAFFLAGFSITALAGNTPYIVRGNNHIIIGVSLNEAAVRAALPAGLEPAKGVTGGYNVYRSDGGYKSPAYTRAYVWVDLKGHDSASGNKARYILWGLTGPGVAASRAAGYDFYDGTVSLVERGGKIIGLAEQNGDRKLRVEIKLGDKGCKPASGILNYPAKLPSNGKMVMHQFPYAGDICGATPVSVDILAETGHPLVKFKPTKLLWAVQAKNLSFAGTTTSFK